MGIPGQECLTKLSSLSNPVTADMIRMIASEKQEDVLQTNEIIIAGTVVSSLHRQRHSPAR
jgi:hypothetical protein